MKKLSKFFKNLEYIFNTSNLFLVKIFRKIIYFEIFNNFFVNKKDLAFFYDLNVNPVTFDFAHHLVQAEEFRREKNLKKIDIFIVKSNYKIPARMINFAVKNSEFEVENRAYEIIFSLTKLLNTVDNRLLINKNFIKKNNLISKYKHVFPNGYSYSNPVPCKKGMSKTNSKYFYPMFAPSPRNLEIIKKYLNGIKKKIITISIRNSFYIKSRNSNLKEWLKFAKYLKKKYEVIIIPDGLNYSLSDKKKFKNFIVADYVVWNLSLRTALYQKAFVNCSIISGPAEICSMYNQNSKSLIFLDEKSYPKKYLKMCKEEWGESEIQPWMSKNHKYVYKSDNFENLKKEFEIFVKKIKIK